MVRLKVRDIEVGRRIGESSKFRIYLGKTPSEQSVILKVAKTFEDGDVLALEAGEFNILYVFSEQIAKFERKAGLESARYDLLFANLIASFLEPTQDDRRINVFAMPEIDVSELIPLTKLSSTVEIDARTSVWILGRLFKFYSFFELIAADGDNPISRYPFFSPDDYMIGPEKHRIIYYNFTGDLADVVAYNYVRAVASFVFNWTVFNNDPIEQEYRNLLKDFVEVGRDSFEQAHKELYDLVKKIWGISYYPFTYRDCGSMVWNKKGE